MCSTNSNPGFQSTNRDRRTMRLADAPIANAPDRKASITRRVLGHLSRRSSLSTFASRARSSNANPSSTSLAASSTSLATPRTRHRHQFAWSLLPCEIKLNVLSRLGVTHLIRVSRTSREFYRLCFDWQLWATFSVEECCKDIRVATIERIFVNAGPYMKKLNLRGCTEIAQMSEQKLSKSNCTNLTTAILQDSRLRIDHVNLLITENPGIVHLNVSGLYTFRQPDCAVVASTYSKLEVLNVSSCYHVSVADVIPILKGCPKLRDLSLSKAKGFSDQRLCHRFFKHSKNIDRLVLRCCPDLGNLALGNMLHGQNPPCDAFTGERLAPPPRKLRYLDISYCTDIDDIGIKSIAECAPNLEALFLAGLIHVTEQGLRQVLRSAKKLAVLDLQDLDSLNDHFLEVLVGTPCARTLKGLSFSRCPEIMDHGVVQVLEQCPQLSYIQLDNTLITDATLRAAGRVVCERQWTQKSPHVGLTMEVFDCAVTWKGIQSILMQNSLAGAGSSLAGTKSSTQIISLKCCHMIQPIVDEHTKRMLQGRFASASQLVYKWACYTQDRVNSGRSIVRYRRHLRGMRLITEPVAFDMSEDDAEDIRYVNEEGRRLSWTGSCVMM